jgi:tripartite-type tricarboxylate transporter receptor subunit TctC
VAKSDWPGRSPTQLASMPSQLAPVTNVKELVALLKSNPARHSFAHPGIGTTAELAGEMFRDHTLANRGASDCQFLLLQGAGRYDWIDSQRQSDESSL